jgi:hypothetical protein
MIKNIAIGALFIVIVLLWSHSCDVSTRHDLAIGVIDGQEQEIKRYKDGYGRSVSEVVQIKVDSKDVGILDKKMADLGLENIKLKNLLSLKTVEYKYSIDTVFVDLPVEIVGNDSLEIKYSFDNGFLSTSEEFLINTQTLKYTADLQYRYATRISITEERKRHFFRPNESIVTFTNSDPNSFQEGESSYEVVQGKKRLGLGLHLGLSYLNNKLRPVVSAGLNYNIL